MPTFKREVLGPTLSREQALTVLRWLNSLSKEDYATLGSLWDL